MEAGREDGFLAGEETVAFDLGFDFGEDFGEGFGEGFGDERMGCGGVAACESGDKRRDCGEGL